MSGISYITRVFRTASLDRLKAAVDLSAEMSGKSKSWIFRDMIHCLQKFGAGYNDYQSFGFYDLTDEERDTYVTRLRAKKIHECIQDMSYDHYFNNKNEFNRLFRKYMRRDFIYIPEASKDELIAFLKDKDVVFAKPNDSEGGKGVRRVVVSDYDSLEMLANELITGDGQLIEEAIVQHPDLAAVHPNSVNCMRIITLIDDNGEPHLLNMVQKFGMDGKFTDNASMYAPVDPETGKLKYLPVSFKDPRGIQYSEHPDTHADLTDFTVPMVKEAVEMCFEAAKIIPQMRYVGWDVTITPDGPAFIEGNDYFCAHDFWQIPPHTPDHIGVLPAIREYVAEINKII